MATARDRGPNLGKAAARNKCPNLGMAAARDKGHSTAKGT